MSYTLQAIVVSNRSEAVLEEYGLSSVELAGGLNLIPLTFDYVKSRDIPFLPLTDEGLSDISGNLLNICQRFSSKGKAVYVEAEYFGGEGTQASVFFEGGKKLESANIHNEAINDALHWLGVSVDDHYDEFEAVGLDQYRTTEQWLNA